MDSFHQNGARTDHDLAWAAHAEAVCSQIDKERTPLHTLESVLAELNQ